jgi:5,5'-dehydrodivanillate O-demethylase
MADPTPNADSTPAPYDVHRTGPATIAGRYMRLFWQPIYHSEDLPRGRTKPIKIMNVDYTLYRGEDGRPYVTQQRCPHRGLQLSAGTVEGDSIRCYYHGWKFAPDGACVAQPAEPRPFCDKVRIKTYPAQDYLGLVFAYLGEERPAPELPRYPDVENIDGILECDSYFRGCNYYNNLENGLDLTHSGFVHRNNPGSFDGLTYAPRIKAEESIWGVTVSAHWPDQVQRAQLGLPNIFHHKAQPTDPQISLYREFLAWWVPIDDHSHTQFTVAAVRLPKEKAAAYLERRQARLARRTQPSAELADKILRGEMYRDEVDPATTDYVRMQDHIAQIGQGTIADHSQDTLGQGDIGIAYMRRMWQRELKALDEGRPLKPWYYDPAQLPVSRGDLWEERRAQQVTLSQNEAAAIYAAHPHEGRPDQDQPQQEAKDAV